MDFADRGTAPEGATLRQLRGIPGALLEEVSPGQAHDLSHLSLLKSKNGLLPSYLWRFSCPFLSFCRPIEH